MIVRSRRLIFALAFVFAVQSYATSVARADEVLDWNAIAIRCVFVAPAVGGALQPRILATVHVSMFDAINGIERRYTPIHVGAAAPGGASRRVAAVQPAYTALTLLFPAQTATLNAELEKSLAAIVAEDALENSVSIERGRAWGETVATEIVAWRNLDGATAVLPAWLGGPEIGRWRPTHVRIQFRADLNWQGFPGCFLR